MPPRDTRRGEEKAPPEAPASESAVVVEERMPDEFPVDFAEWAAGCPGPLRFLVAGYRQRVREQEGLTALKLRNAWEAGFAAFRQTGR